MRVLDLDMDYFMKSVATFINESEPERLPEEDYWDSVWSEREVRNFLEGNLGLSKQNRIRDQIIEAIALFHARAGYTLVIINPGIDPFGMISEKPFKMLPLNGETILLFVLLGGYAGIRGHTDSFTIAGNVIT